MTELFGITRNVVKGRHALLTPGSLVPSHLPGWEKSVCLVLISPALGARFSQLLIAMEREGQCAGNTGANQYFIYVLEGNPTLMRLRELEVIEKVAAGGNLHVSLGEKGLAERLVNLL